MTAVTQYGNPANVKACHVFLRKTKSGRGQFSLVCKFNAVLTMTVSQSCLSLLQTEKAGSEVHMETQTV